MQPIPSVISEDTLAKGKPFRPEIKLRAFRGAALGSVNRHWVQGDPFATAFFNCLSAIFPQAETFMIKSLSKWTGRVPTDLARTIRNFVDQEAGHSREHVAMNKGLTNAGYDISALDQAIRSLVHKLDGLDDVTTLTATVCMEHLTAIVAAEVLANNRLHDSDAELYEVWHWHCLEEVEHKGVAFDVWLHATREWSGLRRWTMRTSFMIAITASFLANRLRGQIALLRQDGIGAWAAFFGAMRYGFGSGGIGRKVVTPWAAFFKPGFQPWDIDDRALIILAEAQLVQTTARRTTAADPVERRAGPRLKKAA